MVNFLRYIQKLLKSAEDLIRTGNGFGVVIKTTNNLVIGIYYSNLLKNFFENLNEENIKEYSSDKSEIKMVKKKFNGLAKRASKNLKTITNKCNIYQKDYDDFKKELKKYKSSFKLLLKIEKLMDKDKCDTEIRHFLEKIKNENWEEMKRKFFDKNMKVILGNIFPEIDPKVIKNEIDRKMLFI